MKLISSSTASLAVLVATVSQQQVEAHSWMDCVQLDGTKCIGFARGWANIYNVDNIVYAQDTGRDNRPGKPVSAGLACDAREAFDPSDDKSSVTSYLSKMYSDKYPHTKFAAGQRVTMRWPAKNHATVGEQRGVQVYFSKPYTPANGKADDFSNVADKATWVKKYPALDVTFTNCSPNQREVDAAPCTGTFTVPSDLQAGSLYTMMWWWEFNQGEFYNTCADVEILGGANGGGGGGGDGGGGAVTPVNTYSPTSAPTSCVCVDAQGQSIGGIMAVDTPADNTGVIVGGIAGAGVVLGVAMYTMKAKSAVPVATSSSQNGYPPNAEQLNFFQNEANL